MAENEEPATLSERTDRGRDPLVFISHDSRDGDLAEAFANLIQNCSGGFVKSFRSSDRKGTEGIAYGTEWYREIMQQLSDATDVVALLTRRSIDRPWILYEVGVAKGKLDKPVLGLALGMPLSEASTGPFAAFQNCGDDVDSLTKLVKQLITGNGRGDPREEMMRQCVEEFRKKIPKLVAKDTEASKPSSPTDVLDFTARQFEEIKAGIKSIHSMLSGGARRQPGLARDPAGRMLVEALESRHASNWADAWKAQGPVPDMLNDLAIEVHWALSKGEETQIRLVVVKFCQAMAGGGAGWGSIASALLKSLKDSRIEFLGSQITDERLKGQ